MMNNLTNNQLIIAALILFGVMYVFAKGMLAKRKVRTALEKGALVIDVRTPSEFGSGHYKGAVNIPHDRIGDSLKKIGAVDRNIIVYCASGSRSSMAARILRMKGYAKVTNAGALASMP
jgi:phage shock protein E